MPLSDEEKRQLDLLIDMERMRQRNLPEDKRTLFWLVDTIAADRMRVEAHRLVADAVVIKQAEVNAWPAEAQAKLARLQSELAVLQTLEGKLGP